MLSDQSLFTSFVNQKVTIKTGNRVDNLFASGIGDTSVNVNGKTQHLSGCLFVPDISQQLVSLVRLINGSVMIKKENDLFTISDDNGQLFSRYVLDNLLQVLYSQCPKAMVSSTKPNHSTWHQRLGHPGNDVIKTMNLPQQTAEGLCEVCTCSKITLLPFPSHFPSVTRPLERLHMDLVGPITPASVSGFKYFLTVVDQYSSFKFVCFLKA
jgi:hypothetical protein